MQGAVSKAAPLALPRHALLCEWCERPIAAYGSWECPSCLAKFERCLAAEEDFRRRLMIHAESIMADWVQDWAHHPALTAPDTADELLGALWDVLKGFGPKGYDLAPINAAFATAWAQERGQR